MGTRYICLLGGEPLVRNDLPEIVDYILGKNMLVALNANGTIKGKNLEVLRRFLNVSIVTRIKRRSL